jgi:hypothetical protein
LQKDPSFFGISTLPNADFKWPELPLGLNEDLPRAKLKVATKFTEKRATVQQAASDLFPAFLEHLSAGGLKLTAGFVDTHASAMSNGAKPDQTHPAVGCRATPAHVRFLGDLKRRRKQDTSPSFTSEEKEHVIGFALQWLEMEPIRPHFVVYLTDLKWIQFFKVLQSGELTESPVLEFPTIGQRWLAGLLVSTDEAIGYPNITQPSFGGELAVLERFLGCGATSNVYQQRGPGGTKFALKLFNNAEEAGLEFHNLTQLNEAIEHANEVPNHVRKMIPPSAEVVLCDAGRSLRLPWVGSAPMFTRLGFVHLVDFLQFLHEHKIAHRDIRPSNLITYGERLLPIDFGSLCALNEEVPYHGTRHYASDRVLHAFEQETKTMVASQTDDLHSLVRTARALVASDQNEFTAKLNSLKKPMELTQFWKAELQGEWCGAGVCAACSRPYFCICLLSPLGWWVPFVNSASNCDYHQLKKCFDTIYL